MADDQIKIRPLEDMHLAVDLEILNSHISTWSRVCSCPCSGAGASNRLNVASLKTTIPLENMWSLELAGAPDQEPMGPLGQRGSQTESPLETLLHYFVTYYITLLWRRYSIT